MIRFIHFTDEELDAMETAFCNEGLTHLVDEIRKEREYREIQTKCYQNLIMAEQHKLKEKTPKIKEGHWIHHPEISFICAEHWECSVCHKSTMTNPMRKDNDYDNMNFCPKCGARMIERLRHRKRILV